MKMGKMVSVRVPVQIGTGQRPCVLSYDQGLVLVLVLVLALAHEHGTTAQCHLDEQVGK